MQVIRSVSALQAALQVALNHDAESAKTVGFVPTMGALHAGHMSLIAASRGKCDVTVCSIFVNPTQFNEASDLANYPKPEKEDLELLTSAGCDLVFIPSVEEIYPNGQEKELVDYGSLTALWEGANRPGHFDGVAQVVSRLFEVVNPQMAFFGEKDFQQLAVIRRMVEQKGLEIEIVGCPIVRDDAGLALSSRNVRLSASGYIDALQLNMAMYEAVKLAKSQTPKKITSFLIDILDSENSGLKVEYLSIVDSASLKPLDLWTEVNARVLIAAWVEGIRLIDNMEIGRASGIAEMKAADEAAGG